MTSRALAAELIGTFMIVLVTCAAYQWAAPPAGSVTVALAAGLAVLAATATLGHLSGGHFNPALTVGLVAAGRCDPAALVGYILAQVAGAIAAVYVLQAALGGFALTGTRPAASTALMLAAANTYAEARGVTLAAAVITEVVATAVLVIVAAAGSARGTQAGAGALALGCAVAVLCLLALPITNASFNPARSTGPAIAAGGMAMAQLWVFWAAPIAGGIAGGAVARWLFEER